MKQSEANADSVKNGAIVAKASKRKLSCPDVAEAEQHTLETEKKDSFIQKSNQLKPIKINLSSSKQGAESSAKLIKAPKLEQVFNQDEDIEEEMPPEARIRMRNRGRDTPTSSGPNSYGKGKFGFVDRRALLNKQLEAFNTDVSNDN